MVSFKWDNERAIQIAKEEYFEIGKEKGIAIGEAIGEARGVKKGIMQATVRLLQNSAPLPLITASTGLTPDEVEQTAKENGLAL